MSTPRRTDAVTTTIVNGMTSIRTAGAPSTSADAYARERRDIGAVPARVFRHGFRDSAAAVAVRGAIERRRRTRDGEGKRKEKTSVEIRETARVGARLSGRFCFRQRCIIRQSRDHTTRPDSR